MSGGAQARLPYRPERVEIGPSGVKIARMGANLSPNGRNKPKWAHKRVAGMSSRTSHAVQILGLRRGFARVVAVVGFVDQSNQMSQAGVRCAL